MISPSPQEGPLPSQLFAVPGRPVHAERFGSGHIHQTWLVRYQEDGETRDYILQRLNERVFPNLEAVCQNIQRVCEHLGRGREETPSEAMRPGLDWVPAPAGGILARAADGSAWRMCRRIEGVYTVDRTRTRAQAWQTGWAFGRFQHELRDLDPSQMQEVLPDFHHTPRRCRALEAAARLDPLGRVAQAQAELGFVRARLERAGQLVSLQAGGHLPERITHNDTKINNVLLDQATDEALCVIDLDTVMPGPIHHDFGDMIRTVTNGAEEDEADLDRVEMRLPWFEALAEGYLEATRAFLTPIELEHLVFSGWLLTFEVGVRFLTDYLEGDRYFQIHTPDHNLRRCRAQLALVRSIERQEREMTRALRRLAPTAR